MAASHESTQKQASPHGQMSVTDKSANPHGTGKSSLKTFAAECGLTELSEKNVKIFGYAGHAWTALRPQDQGDQYSVIAKVWSDAAGKPRVVDVSESLNESGDALRVAHMCYSPKGTVRKVSEHYVNLPACGCGRESVIAYDEQGKQTKDEQSWYKMPGHEAVDKAHAPKNVPEVNVYHSVSELPFANLLKGKNATSH